MNDGSVGSGGRSIVHVQVGVGTGVVVVAVDVGGVPVGEGAPEGAAVVVGGPFGEVVGVPVDEVTVGRVVVVDVSEGTGLLVPRVELGVVGRLVTEVPSDGVVATVGGRGRT